MLVKLRNALAALESGDAATACDLLGAFINEVNPQAGKKMSLEDAAAATEIATAARTSVGCG